MTHLGLVAGFFLLSLFLGSGLWLLLASPRQRPDAALFLCLSPIVGIAWACLWLSNAFSLKVPFRSASVGFALVTILLNGFSYFRHRRELKGLLATVASSKVRSLLFLGLALVIAGVLLLPVIGQPCLTAPWRIGPDAPGYAGTAQFILAGRSSADLTADNIFPTDMFAREFLWRALRRGFSLVLALYSGTFHLHAVQAGFYLVALSYLLLTLGAMKVFADVFGEKDTVSAVLAGLVLGLNCNLLFIFLEGGYGQIVSMALCMGVLLAVSAYLRVRVLSRRAAVRLLLIVGLLIAAAVTSYSESAFLVIGVSVGYWILSFIRVRFRPKPVLLLLPLLVLALSPGVVGSWISFQIRNVGNLANGGIGWPQPQWAYVLELLGIRDLYDVPIDPTLAYMKPVEPQGGVLFISVALSLLFFASTMTLFFLRKNRASQWLFLGTGLIVAAHLFFRLQLAISSYAYTKIAVFLLPLVLVGGLGTLTALINSSIRRWLIGGCLCAIVSYNGIHALLSYRAQAYYLTPGDLELTKVPRIQGNRIVLVNLPKPRRGELNMLVALLNGKWTSAEIRSAQAAHDWAADTSPILFLQRESAAKTPDSPGKETILWQGSDYRLIDPGLRVNEAVR